MARRPPKLRNLRFVFKLWQIFILSWYKRTKLPQDTNKKHCNKQQTSWISFSFLFKLTKNINSLCSCARVSFFPFLVVQFNFIGAFEFHSPRKNLWRNQQFFHKATYLCLIMNGIALKV